MKEDIIRNMNQNGGGLATSITGKFESNRHALAKMEKLTFGEVASELRKKKNGGFDINAKKLLEIYRELFGEPEWHHAGKLPKQYGGGMKKTYFLNQVPSKEEFEDWLFKYGFALKEKENDIEFQKKKEKKRIRFLKQKATHFSRVSKDEIPKYSIVLEEEMNGKFGWFEADYKYSLPIFYSGYYFKSKRSLERYLREDY